MNLKSISYKKYSKIDLHGNLPCSVKGGYMNKLKQIYKELFSSKYEMYWLNTENEQHWNIYNNLRQIVIVLRILIDLALCILAVEVTKEMFIALIDHDSRLYSVIKPNIMIQFLEGPLIQVAIVCSVLFIGLIYLLKQPRYVSEFNKVFIMIPIMICIIMLCIYVSTEEMQAVNTFILKFLNYAVMRMILSILENRTTNILIITANKNLEKQIPKACMERSIEDE